MPVSIAAMLCCLLFLEIVLTAHAAPLLDKRDADFASVRTRLNKPYVDTENDPPEKYFHESNFHQHYDGRFADIPLKYDEKQAHLSALIQTYLLTMNDIGLETWLMHGTLLGWWWNRQIMPWDSDIDVMVSESSMRFLAHYHNMTTHTFKLPGIQKPREYLLEINPHYREKALTQSNRIDARWIDTEIGLFIDVTTIHRNATEENPDAMVVKDKHHYSYDDIYPLRDGIFEGVPVSIPFAYPEILAEEYGHEALSGIRYENHRFDEESRTWIPQAVKLSSRDHDG